MGLRVVTARSVRSRAALAGSPRRPAQRCDAGRHAHNSKNDDDNDSNNNSKNDDDDNDSNNNNNNNSGQQHLQISDDSISKKRQHYLIRTPSCILI